MRVVAAVEKLRDVLLGGWTKLRERGRTREFDPLLERLKPLATVAARGAESGADALVKLHARVTRGGPEPVLDDSQQELLGLITEFDALDLARRDDVARATTMLWNAFAERFGGVDGFIAASETDQAAYVAGLDQAWRRMWSGRGSAKGHYVFAAALVARYLGHWRDGGAGTALTRELGKRVVSLIERGRRLDPMLAPQPGEDDRAATTGERAAG
jgi:hypothetical protein